MILKKNNNNRILVNRQNRAVSMLKKVVSLLKNYNTMKDKKTLEVLLKVIQRVYDKNPGMQKVIDALMKEVCAEEGVSPE